MVNGAFIAILTAIFALMLFGWIKPLLKFTLLIVILTIPYLYFGYSPLIYALSVGFFVILFSQRAKSGA